MTRRLICTARRLAICLGADVFPNHHPASLASLAVRVISSATLSLWLDSMAPFISFALLTAASPPVLFAVCCDGDAHAILSSRSQGKTDDEPLPRQQKTRSISLVRKAVLFDTIARHALAPAAYACGSQTTNVPYQQQLWLTLNENAHFDTYLVNRRNSLV